ncbi:phosphate transport system substrate-binding protein [Pararobbsia alpina]|uniref:substrate-binding domain-containing protein n=1 Tax=Pararobbsia alpina TaxID=621374 RepID=UPI0039A40927
MKSSKRKICQVVALVISSMGATMAMAGTPSLLGGGSSLVAPTIQSEISAFPAADGSVTYSSVGSGLGQTAFLSNSPSSLNSGTVTYTGTVDFANSDAGLSATQISAYQSSTLGTTSGPLIQIPYIVTPITIPVVNGPNGSGPTLPNGGTTKTVALNDSDLCGIFSGKLTNWNQVFNPVSSVTYAKNATITVVYRSDNSGTTDLLTRHLAAVCSSTTSNITFTETQNLAGLFTAAGKTVPANFVSASGSGGVAAVLVASAGGTAAAIGYLSPDYTNTFLAPSSAQAKTNNLNVASLLNANSNTMEIPTFSAATTALGSAAAPTGSAASQPINWVPNVGNPTSGYPVSGTSQIILSQCYANAGAASPTPAQSIVDFLTAHYADTSVINGNGFDVPGAYVSAITADFLSNTSTLGLDIGDSTVCSKVTGR